MSGSLRGRLTGAIVAVTGPTVAILVAALYMTVAAALWADYDRRLAEDAAIFAGLVEWDPEDGYELDGGEAIVRLLAATESPLHVDVRGPAGPLIEGPELAALAADEAARTMFIGDNVALRVLRRQALVRADGGAAPDEAIVVTVARDTAEIEALLAAIARWFWMIGALTVLLACVVAVVVVSRGLRPVVRLGREIDAIDDIAAPLALSTRSLPGELQPIVGKLEALWTRLQGAFERERRFAGDVAHELRTPLAVLRASIELALRDADDPAALRGRLGGLVDGVDQMTRLVTSLLQLARVESGHEVVDLQPVALAALVEACWAPLADRAIDRGLRFDHAIGAAEVARADPEKLRSILHNLLENAATYTEVGGSIRVTTTPTEGVILAVVDSGPPIAAADLPRLFDRFWRADQARGGDGAHCGLGLGLARALARAQGLEVTIDNRGDGAVVARILRAGPSAGVE